MPAPNCDVTSSTAPVDMTLVVNPVVINKVEVTNWFHYDRYSKQCYSNRH